MPGITYEVLEKFGILSESTTGWTKEFRLMNWNNHGPRYDLREWAPGDRKASRGITLSLKEIKVLQEILVELDFPMLPDDDETDSEGLLSEDIDDAGYQKTGSARRKAG